MTIDQTTPGATTTTVGVQAMMLRESFERVGAFETMREISDIGYHAVEISQIAMTPENVSELARARDELGMDIAALSAMYSAPVGSGMDALVEGYDKIVGDCRALDASMLRIGMLPFDAVNSVDRIIDFAQKTDVIAQRLLDEGISLYYHNHHIEFAKHDGAFLLDIIAEHAPNIGIELDVHWVQRGGLDPVRTLRKYGDRVAMVHLKDYRIGSVPQEALEAIARRDIPAFQQGFRNGVVEFAEVGQGNLDFAAIVEESLRIGARYLLVEQDDLYGRTALECLQTSRDHLVALGYERLFANPAEVS